MFRKLIKKNFDKVVYSSPTVNKISRNLNKALQSLISFRLRPYGVLTVRYGKISFKMATNETSFVTKQLFWKGARNFEYTPIFERLVRHCASFIDIGANTGYYSLLAAKANPAIFVHAFEPASGPFHFLERNVMINELNKRVWTHPIALSNQRGEVEFFEILNPEGTFAKYNLSGVGGLKKTHETQEHSVRKMVTAEALDDYHPRLNLDVYDLIKIDTEGTENLVLEGAADIIKKYKPIIICETLFNKIEAKLEILMKGHGYMFFNHINGELYKTESIVRAIDNGVSDCFFVHPDKEHLIKDFIANKR